MQDEIAAAIAGALRVKLSATPRRSVNVAAYEAFLKGKHHWARLTPDALARSRECYEQAVALDPGFALARHALAEHFFALTANGLMPSQEVIPLVRKWALEALEIDPELAEPHALLGLLAATVVYDWPESASRLQLAMSHEPVTSYVRWFHGLYLMQIGRLHEAVDEMERMLHEDPLHVLCRSQLSGCLYALGRRARCFPAIATGVGDRRGLLGRPLVPGSVRRAWTERCAEARTAAERAYSLMPKEMNAGSLAGICRARGIQGALKHCWLICARVEMRYGMPMAWFTYDLARLEMDQAAASIEKAIEQHDQRAAYGLSLSADDVAMASAGEEIEPARRLTSVTSAACLNCGATLNGPFCSACGQRAVPPHPTTKELVGDVYDELVGWDGKFARTLRLLLAHPGALTRAVIEGRRNSYVRSVRLYLCAVSCTSSCRHGAPLA